jgi:hypothetical protein
MKKFPVGFAGSLLQFAALFQSWLVSPTHVASARLMEGKPTRAKAITTTGLNFFNRLKRLEEFSVWMTFIISSGILVLVVFEHLSRDTHCCGAPENGASSSQCAESA